MRRGGAAGTATESNPTSGTIEIELKSGDRVRVEGCADAGLVARIVSALRRA